MVLWQTWWAGIYQVEYCLGGNYIIWNFLDCNDPGGNFPGGTYPGWKFPGGSYPGRELSEWELPWVGIFFGGAFPVGNCLGENHPGGNFPEGSFPSTGNQHDQSYWTPSGLMLVKFWVWRKSTLILTLFYSHLLSVYSHLQLDGIQNTLIRILNAL